MKKVIYLLIGVLLSLPSVATEMCARNDTVVIPLDATVNGTGRGQDGTESMWWTIFSYGRVYGLSTCLSADEGGAPNGGMGTTKNSKGQTLPNDEALAGRSGTDADGNERRYCWCKMTHPMSSLWVFSVDFGSASYCSSTCTSNCGALVQSSAALRGVLFGSVGVAANAAY